MDLSRSAKAGALCWITAAALFLAANVITALAWNPPYSWATHNISDLGNVTCGIWDTSRPRPVCSPWHPLMNTALLVTAVLLAAGTVLTWRAVSRGFAARTAQLLLLFAALGYALAGAFPADVDENNHFLGALLVIGMGNLGLLLAGLVKRDTPLGNLRGFTLASSLIALTGSVAFFSQHGLGIGVGAMERVAVFPLPIWALSVGAVLVKTGQGRPSPARQAELVG